MMEKGTCSKVAVKFFTWFQMFLRLTGTNTMYRAGGKDSRHRKRIVHVVHMIIIRSYTLP